MLKEAKPEETISFFVAFLCLVTFQLGAGGGIPGYTYVQARSQDLEKGGGYFERVRSVQTTLTQIFIALKSVSHGLHEN